MKLTDKFSRKFIKNKKNKKKISNEFSLYLPFIIHLVFAFFYYALSKDLIGSLCIMLLGITSILFLEKPEESSKQKNNNNLILTFYQDFMIYSGIEKDFQQGFIRALDQLPISELKDKLLDYKEAGYQSEFPIKLDQSREEFQFTSMIRSLLYHNEEYCYESLKLLEQEFESYQRNQKKVKKDLSIVISLLPYAFTLFLLIMRILEHAI